MNPAPPKFYLNNTLINPPQNWREMLSELNFDRDNSLNQQAVSITEWDLVRENTDIILKHIEDGLTTGVGVFEGIPFRVELERAGDLEVLFDGYLDLPQSSAFSKIKCNVKAVETFSIDWLNDVADSFTFDYLYRETGTITDADFIKVPYIISSVPNYTNAVVALIGVYIMVGEVKRAIENIAEFVASMPLYYVFSTYIRLIIYIIALILVIIALVKLLKDLMLLLIQPVKYHSGMRIATLLQKGCDHLGLKFKSEFFDAGGVYENTCIIPSKFYAPPNKKDRRLLGLTDPKINQEGFYKGTFGQLLRDVKLWVNGKVVISGNELRIVRDDYAETGNNYILPPIEQFYFTTNAGEFVSNTYITFETDLSEKNTVQQYHGTAYQLTIQPVRVNFQNMVLMKGLNEVRLPFALAKKKTELTVPEDIMNTFLKTIGKIIGGMVKAVNAVIKVLNKVIQAVNNVIKKLNQIGIKVKFELPEIPLVNFPNFADEFSNRIGMMLIEYDQFNVQKIVDLDIKSDPKQTKISNENSTILSARYLYHNFYYIDSFIPTADRPNGNQCIKKSFKNVPFAFQDFKKVKANNFIFTSAGEEAYVQSLKWNPYTQTADMELRISKLYTNNLKSTDYEPDGQ